MIKHGMKGTQIYGVWCNMKTRCNNPSSKFYPAYGGRGINICTEWESFAEFYKDMGDPPSSKHQIDRIDNNKGYHKANCHWVIRIKNMQNQKASKRWVLNCVVYNSSGEAAKFLGVSPNTIMNRCKGYIWGGIKYPPKPDCYCYAAYPHGG